MHHFITGVAGFIGSQLADALLLDGDRVSGIDDLSLGRVAHLEGALTRSEFRFEHGDCSDPTVAEAVLKTTSRWGGTPDLVWHLAANSDISAGVIDLSIDYSRTLGTTFGLLKAAAKTGVKRIAFASTSAIYGELAGYLTEDSGPLLPISNYGATKLASEALLSAAVETLFQQIWIFRFPNIVGPRATHGAIYDFINRLKLNRSRLVVLGDGKQTKPYLHVSELIEAMRFIVKTSNAKRNIFNIAPEGPGTSVSYMAEQVVLKAAPGAEIIYSGGDRGWIGDVPRFTFSTQRLADLGWRARHGSDSAVVRAIDELVIA